jgi:hypothetical protein
MGARYKLCKKTLHIYLPPWSRKDVLILLVPMSLNNFSRMWLHRSAITLIYISHSIASKLWKLHLIVHEFPNEVESSSPHPSQLLHLQLSEYPHAHRNGKAAQDLNPQILDITFFSSLGSYHKIKQSYIYIWSEGWFLGTLIQTVTSVKCSPQFLNGLSSLYVLRSNIKTRETSQLTGPLLPLALLMMSS